MGKQPVLFCTTYVQRQGFCGRDRARAMDQCCLSHYNILYGQDDVDIASKHGLRVHVAALCACKQGQSHISRRVRLGRDVPGASLLLRVQESGV